MIGTENRVLNEKNNRFWAFWVWHYLPLWIDPAQALINVCTRRAFVVVLLSRRVSISSIPNLIPETSRALLTPF